MLANTSVYAPFKTHDLKNFTNLAHLVGHEPILDRHCPMTKMFAALWFQQACNLTHLRLMAETMYHPISEQKEGLNHNLWGHTYMCLYLLIFNWHYSSHVSWQEAKHFSPLGINTIFLQIISEIGCLVKRLQTVNGNLYITVVYPTPRWMMQNLLFLFQNW